MILHVTQVPILSNQSVVSVHSVTCNLDRGDTKTSTRCYPQLLPIRNNKKEIKELVECRWAIVEMVEKAKDPLGSWLRLGPGTNYFQSIWVQVGSCSIAAGLSSLSVSKITHSSVLIGCLIAGKMFLWRRWRESTAVLIHIFLLF